MISNGNWIYDAIGILRFHKLRAYQLSVLVENVCWNYIRDRNEVQLEGAS